MTGQTIAVLYLIIIQNIAGLKGTVKEKRKGGIGWKLITLALDRDPWKFYLMFLSREIDIKLC